MGMVYSFRSGGEWWRQAVIYQIFPASFQDTNGDGMGDLPGILARLDYLSWLGVDAIWLSPFYPSPFQEAGYDIADFCGVDPIFGTMEDFDRLLAEAHARGLKVILDFVPNHTSDQHPWFIESRASRDNPKRDWYIWHDPAPDGGAPNNWLSRFGGSGWEFDGTTGQYYYHAFLPEQPDLNWRNPEVRHAMLDVLRFWLDRGVDGFRVDASAVLVEDDLLRDDPPDPSATKQIPPPERQSRVFTDSRPEVFDCLVEMRAFIDRFPGRLMAGEADTSTDRLARFYGSPDKPCLHFPLSARLLETPWQKTALVAALDTYLNALPEHGWPNWMMGSHDKPRIASRTGAAQARIAAMLHLALPGTIFLYAGDELGMPEMPVPRERIRDPFETRLPGFGLGRDPQRTPMRWTPEPGAGFSTGEPWLPVGPAVEILNVATQREDSGSILSLYQALLRLRRNNLLLREGSYEPLRSGPNVLAFRRFTAERSLLVALNLGAEEQTVDLTSGGRMLLSTHLNRAEEHFCGKLLLRPHEGALIQLQDT